MNAKKVTSLVIAPKTLAEANNLLVRLGQYERTLSEINLALEAEQAAAKARANQAAAPLEAAIAATVKALKTYATRERKSLLADGKKSVVLPGGEFGWRMTPAKVTVKKDATEGIIANLEKLGLKQYLRVVTELDKDALLKDRPTLAGVSYAQTERFYTKPESAKQPETYPGDARA
jgi:phage host-nuclease inhibitor protein Gam